jgi:hypothetical protein
VLAQLVRLVLNTDMECHGCLSFLKELFSIFLDEIHFHLVTTSALLALTS